MTQALVDVQRFTVRALPRVRSAVLAQPAVQVLPAAPRRSVTLGVVAGPKGDKGDAGQGELAIIIGNTAPTGRTQPWLRVEVDGDGDPQGVWLGTP